LEDIDFSGLLARYSSKERTGYNPIMMYALVTYANMRGVRAVDRIAELCEPKTRRLYKYDAEKDEVKKKDFRRFYYRSSGKVYKEFRLYAISRNLNKYHRFLHGKIKKFKEKDGQKTA
jgi:hypothetical protein